MRNGYGEKVTSVVSVWGLIVLIVSISSPAVAEDGQMGGEEAMTDVDDVDEADEEAYEQMLQLSAEGNELYQEGQFEPAAETYQRAYDAYPQPILLKNQMVARYLLEECEVAIELGERFVDAQTGSGETLRDKFIDSDAGSEEDADDVEAVFGECALDLAEAARDAENWSQVADWLDFGEPFFVEESLREDATELRAQLDAQISGVEEDEDATEVADPGESELDTQTIAGWSLTTLGTGTLVTALVWHLRWQSRHSDLEDMRDEAAQTGDDAAFLSRKAELENSYGRTRVGVPMLYGIGVAATAAGVALLVMPMSEQDPSMATIQPMISRDGAGATFSLSF